MIPSFISQNERSLKSKLVPDQPTIVKIKLLTKYCFKENTMVAALTRWNYFFGFFKIKFINKLQEFIHVWDKMR